MSALVSNTLQRLATEHHWLGRDKQKTARLGELLQEVLAHSGKDAVQLVSQLIKRFVFLSNDEFDDYIYLIADFLKSDFDLEKSIICATTADRQKDSAQVILYGITTTLATLGFFKPNSINRYDSAPNAFKKNSSLKEIILVDEFLGTGQSVIGRVKRLRELFTQAGLPTPPIHFVGIAGMEFGLRRVTPYLHSVNVCICLRKGIHDLSPKSAIAADYALMDKLEGNLSSFYAGEPLPSYGYGSSEALYSRKSGNCPNNVFPIFWWPQMANLGYRLPLFPRSF